MNRICANNDGGDKDHYCVRLYPLEGRRWNRKWKMRFSPRTRTRSIMLRRRTENVFLRVRSFRASPNPNTIKIKLGGYDRESYLRWPSFYLFIVGKCTINSGFGLLLPAPLHDSGTTVSPPHVIQNNN